MGGPLGVALPRRWEGWGPGELERVAELRPAAVLVPIAGDRPTLVLAARAASLRALAARIGARLLLRADEPDVPAWAPNDWAGECARRAGLFARPGEAAALEMIPGHALNFPPDGALAWDPGAEPARPRAGRPARPEERAASPAATARPRGPSWLLRFAQRYRRLRPGERLHLPAPSIGEGGADAVVFWAACARSGLGRRFDVVDVHAYSDEQVRTLPRLAHEMLGLPVDLTEWGGADPLVVAAEVQARPWLLGACSVPPTDDADVGAERGSGGAPWSAEGPDRHRATPGPGGPA